MRVVVPVGRRTVSLAVSNTPSRIVASYAASKIARRNTAMGAERAELYRLSQARELSDDVARRLVREVDLMEAGANRSSRCGSCSTHH